MKKLTTIFILITIALAGYGSTNELKMIVRGMTCKADLLYGGSYDPMYEMPVVLKLNGYFQFGKDMYTFPADTVYLSGWALANMSPKRVMIRVERLTFSINGTNYMTSVNGAVADKKDNFGIEGRVVSIYKNSKPSIVMEYTNIILTNSLLSISNSKYTGSYDHPSLSGNLPVYTNDNIWIDKEDNITIVFLSEAEMPRFLRHK